MYFYEIFFDHEIGLKNKIELPIIGYVLKFEPFKFYFSTFPTSQYGLNQRYAFMLILEGQSQYFI